MAGGTFGGETYLETYEYFSAFDRPLTNCLAFFISRLFGASTLSISTQGSINSGVPDCVILGGSVSSAQQYKDAEMESSFANNDYGDWCIILCITVTIFFIRKVSN